MSEQVGLWDSVSTGLGIGGSAAGLIGAAWGAAFVVRRWWNRTVGRRRAQAEILDQLCCTSSMAFVESKLGVPQFITHPDDCEERVYRLPGAWIIVHPVAGAVRWFSITITDPDMYYDIGPTTLGNVPIRLGVDTFADAPSSDHESMQIGARDATFVRYYEYGNTAGGGQPYWLAFNPVGCGTFTGGDPYGTGTYTGHGIQYGTPPETSGITANTLTVMSPEGNPNDMRERWLHGPHHDHVKLAIRERRE